MKNKKIINCHTNFSNIPFGSTKIRNKFTYFYTVYGRIYAPQLPPWKRYCSTPFVWFPDGSIIVERGSGKLWRARRLGWVRSPLRVRRAGLGPPITDNYYITLLPGPPALLLPTLGPVTRGVTSTATIENNKNTHARDYKIIFTPRVGTPSVYPWRWVRVGIRHTRYCYRLPVAFFSFFFFWPTRVVFSMFNVGSTSREVSNYWNGFERVVRGGLFQLAETLAWT